MGKKPVFSPYVTDGKVESFFFPKSRPWLETLVPSQKLSGDGAY